MKKKTGRNDPCPCGSGKKFKKCCEPKLLGKKFMPRKLVTPDLTSKKISQLTSLIKPPPPQEDKQIDVTENKEKPKE